MGSVLRVSANRLFGSRLSRPRRLLLGVPLLLAVGAGAGCRRSGPEHTASASSAQSATAPDLRRATGQPGRSGPPEASREAGAKPAGKVAGKIAAKLDEHRALVRCFPEDTVLSPARPVTALLARSADRYELAAAGGVPRPPAAAAGPNAVPPAAPDKTAPDRSAPGRPAPDKAAPDKAAIDALYREALACADEALRIEPRTIEALHNRGLALQALGQLDGARDAFTRALAIDPDDAETLAGAADLYINHMQPNGEYASIGIEYARRGVQRLRRASRGQALKPGQGPANLPANLREDQRALLARLILLEGQGLIDLGQPRAALVRFDTSIATRDSAQARYERAVALFDLCRFPEAKRGLQEVLARDTGDAGAHHHLGLVLEQLGQAEAAEVEFAAARRLAPADYPELLPVSAQEFRALVDKEVQGLLPEQRADLRHVSLETADLPDLTDLRAEDPPLSPTILGLFRGLPLPTPQSTERDPHSAEQRTIVLYRKNLLRAVKSREELVEQVRMTLLHELGHLRGEDDEELRSRGLE